MTMTQYPVGRERLVVDSQEMDRLERTWTPPPPYNATTSGADTAAYPHAVQLCADSPDVRITPAMAAGISNHVWSLEEIVWLLDTAEKKPRS